MSDYKVVNTTLVNPVVGSANLDLGKVTYYSYGYNVNFGQAVFYAALLAISLFLHVYQAFRYKVRWMLWTVALGAAGEALGWAGRAWSAKATAWESSEGGYWFSPDTPFIIQIVTLIFCPAFIQAANYLVLGIMVAKFGIQYSRLTPRRYLGIFLTVDIFSLLVQAFGGSSASGPDATPHQIDIAIYIMQAGIFFQLAAMVVFSILLAEFSWRFFKDRPLAHPGFVVTGTVTELTFNSFDERRRGKTMIWAIVASNALIFVRSVYRGIEISLGFDGWLAENQALFCIFDGLLVISALYVLNVFHPGRLVGPVRIPRRRELLCANACAAGPSSTEGLVELQLQGV